MRGEIDDRTRCATERAVLHELTGRSPAVVVLLGPAGSGKSFVLRSVWSMLARADREAAVGPAALVLGASASWRPAEVDVALDDPRVASDTRSGAARPRLIVVDDIDLLTREIVSRLVRELDERRIRLLASVRASRADRALAHLRTTVQVAVVTARPWGTTELAVHVQRRWEGGVLHPMSARRLTDFANGNPMCLTELLEVGESSGQFDQRLGVWSWHGPLDVPRLTRARISGELERADARGRCVLATVALADGAPLDLLEGIHGHGTLAGADAAGLLAFVAEGDAEIAVPRDALEGRVAVQALPVSQRRRLGSSVIAALRHRRAGEVAWRIALVAARSGAPVPAELRVPAAEAAAQRHRPAVARNLLDQDADPDVLVVEAKQAALADLDGHLLAARARREPDHPPGHDAEREHGPAPITPLGLRDVAQTARCGQVACALEKAATVDVTRWDPHSRIHLTAVVAWSHLMVGDLGDARRIARGLRMSGLEEDWGYAYHLGALAGGCVELVAADLRSATQLLTECAHPADDDVPDFVRSTALTRLALTQAMSGDVVSARSSLTAAGELSDGPAPVEVRHCESLTRAEIKLVQGRFHAAREEALAVAGRCHDDGLVLLEMGALNIAARSAPSPEAARRLSECTTRADFPLAGTHGAYAWAVADHDGLGLVTAAERYQSSGLHWLAGEAAGRFLAHGRRGASQHSDWLARARMVLERVHQRLDVELPQWWVEEQVFSPLTEREREIGQLAANGWSSPRIAHYLHVSRRTVDNHLQHCYRKLGISRREQLHGALGVSSHESDPPRS